MTTTPNPRQLSKIAGVSYLIIFFSAIFGNFFVVENFGNDPLHVIENNGILVRLGIIAFLITVIFDIAVAWALQELYKGQMLSSLSTFFRLAHALIMGIAVYKLAEVFELDTNEAIFSSLKAFNLIWLIGLLLFGIHLILLGRICSAPKLIRIFLVLAGCSYLIDTCAFILLPDYENYATLFLIMVATSSIIGEMSFTIWLLIKSETHNKSAPQS